MFSRVDNIGCLDYTDHRPTPGKQQMDEKRQKILWDDRQLKRATDENYRVNRPRLEKIVAVIGKSLPTSPGNPARVLNIGTGDARLEGMLLERGYDVYVLDPSLSIVEFAREKYGLDETHARCGWSQDIPFGDSLFDCVVMTEVVEHLDEDTMDQTFQNVLRVLKSGGLFVGTIPDNEDLNLLTTQCHKCGAVSHRVGHQQSFTASSLNLVLKKYFSAVQVHRFRGMYMNWKGIFYHHWIDLPFKPVRLFRPDIRVPHQVVFNLFFKTRKP
jgi:SAM-dependent methyltransferase